jgi:ABC-2 type transport system ATP-binding protein
MPVPTDGSEAAAEGAPAAEAAPEEKPQARLLKVEAENSRVAIVNVLGVLNDRDIPITSLDILEPNLESVFLYLTGKKLRE